MKTGFVYLVGAGPGDPGLITHRGELALGKAEVVIYDHLVHPRLLELVPPSAERIYVGKSRGHHELSQQQINRLLCEKAKQGLTVVRLKGGDPYVFGRGAEESEELYRAGIAFRVIPGVTAGIGALAYAGLAVTHRNHASSVVFVTGHDDPDSPGCQADWPLLAQFQGTIVIYMGVTRLRRIAQVLIEHGKDPDTKVAMVERGSWPGQKVVVSTLGEIAASLAPVPVNPPAIIMIGSVVEARTVLDWWSRLPLAGQTVLVTRPEEDSQSTIDMLEDLGAEVLSAPAITVGPVIDAGPLDQAIAKLNQYQWLVFTSSNGVRFFMDRIFHLGFDLRLLGHLKLAAIGPATAQALKKYGFVADLVPEKYRSEDLAEALASKVATKNVLLARASRGRNILREQLEGVAALVDQVTVYENADAECFPQEIIKRAASGDIDWVTLTSSAIARRTKEFLSAVMTEEQIGKIKFASISPVTSEAARAVGMAPVVEAKIYTIAGMIQAMLEYESGRKSG